MSAAIWEPAGSIEVSERDQLATRPSELVVEWKEVSGAERGVRVTLIFAPGRPVVVSRTWHVIGSF